MFIAKNIKRRLESEFVLQVVFLIPPEFFLAYRLFYRAENTFYVNDQIFSRYSRGQFFRYKHARRNGGFVDNRCHGKCFCSAHSIQKFSESLICVPSALVFRDSIVPVTYSNTIIMSLFDVFQGMTGNDQSAIQSDKKHIYSPFFFAAGGSCSPSARYYPQREAEWKPVPIRRAGETGRLRISGITLIASPVTLLRRRTHIGAVAFSLIPTDPQAALKSS